MTRLFVRGIFRLRLHIVAAYVLIAYSVLKTAGVMRPELWVAVVAMTLILWGTHMLNRVQDAKEDAMSQPEAVPGSPKTLRAVAYGAMLVALCLGAPYGVQALWLLPFILAGVVYSVPVFGVRIKQIFAVKDVFAAGTWSASFLALLVVFGDYRGSLSDAFQGLSQVFFFLLIYEVIHDMRDSEADRAVGTHTLPNRLGFTSTKWLLAVFFTLGLLARIEDLVSLVSVAAFASLCVALLLKKNSPRWLFEVSIFLQIAALLFGVVSFSAH